MDGIPLFEKSKTVDTVIGFTMWELVCNDKASLSVLLVFLLLYTLSPSIRHLIIGLRILNEIQYAYLHYTCVVVLVKE